MRVLGPELINGVWHLRPHVSKDVAPAARGKTLLVPIGDIRRPATVGDVVKVSQRTPISLWGRDPIFRQRPPDRNPRLARLWTRHRILDARAWRGM